MSKSNALKFILPTFLCFLFSCDLFFNPFSHEKRNLLVNGDFGQGNFSFSSDYLYGNVSNTSNRYEIINNPTSVNVAWPSLTDKDGNGKMMMVNGGVGTVWRQDIDVERNMNYSFSGWTVCCYDGYFPNLEVYINHQLIGSFEVTDLGVWKQFSYKWNSGFVDNAILEIKDTLASDNGNDFALDGINFIWSAQ